MTLMQKILPVLFLLPLAAHASASWPFVDVAVMQKRPPRLLHIDKGNCHTSGLGPAVVELRLQQKQIFACTQNEKCISAFKVILKCTKEISLRPDQAHRRHYAKQLTVTAAQKGMRIIARLPLEPYVEQVLHAELGAAPIESQKAQRILIRTYAMRAHAFPRHRDADLCDLTHCQVFSAKKSLDFSLPQGPILKNKSNQPADVYYHSTCGGHTVSAKKVWPGTTSDLVGVDDISSAQKPFCAASPHFRWSTRLSIKDLKQVLKFMGFSEKSTSEIAQDSTGLFIQNTSTESAHKKTRLSLSKFHRAIGKTLGWHRLKSTDFSIQKTATGFLFSGRGLGHQVGLCQYGAMERARQKQSSEQILKAYFPNYHLSSSSSFSSQKQEL